MPGGGSQVDGRGPAEAWQHVRVGPGERPLTSPHSLSINASEPWSKPLLSVTTADLFGGASSSAAPVVTTAAGASPSSPLGAGAAGWRRGCRGEKSALERSGVTQHVSDLWTQEQNPIQTCVEHYKQAAPPTWQRGSRKDMAGQTGAFRPTIQGTENFRSRRRVMSGEIPWESHFADGSTNVGAAGGEVSSSAAKGAAVDEAGSVHSRRSARDVGREASKRKPRAPLFEPKSRASEAVPQYEGYCASKVHTNFAQRLRA
eukprot:TRINITY_DN4203_c0_g7_i1.p1 TRINITY_DN4203_c0_g7~~TRINITY_DN4203_c0_g7_i1.p1  ORF type:complete len:259 (+),score=51.00 TRINITY_DN4203_c0_g7_i1:104-880(+)